MTSSSLLGPGSENLLSPVGTAEEKILCFQSSLRDSIGGFAWYPAMNRWAIFNMSLPDTDLHRISYRWRFLATEDTESTESFSNFSLCSLCPLWLNYSINS